MVFRAKLAILWLNLAVSVLSSTSGRSTQFWKPYSPSGIENDSQAELYVDSVFSNQVLMTGKFAKKSGPALVPTLVTNDCKSLKEKSNKSKSAKLFVLPTEDKTEYLRCRDEEIEVLAVNFDSYLKMTEEQVIELVSSVMTEEKYFVLVGSVCKRREFWDLTRFECVNRGRKTLELSYYEEKLNSGALAAIQANLDTTDKNLLLVMVKDLKEVVNGTMTEGNVTDAASASYGLMKLCYENGDDYCDEVLDELFGLVWTEGDLEQSLVSSDSLDSLVDQAVVYLNYYDFSEDSIIEVDSILSTYIAMYSSADSGPYASSDSDFGTLTVSHTSADSDELTSSSVGDATVSIKNQTFFTSTETGSYIFIYSQKSDNKDVQMFGLHVYDNSKNEIQILGKLFYALVNVTGTSYTSFDMVHCSIQNCKSVELSNDVLSFYVAADGAFRLNEFTITSTSFTRDYEEMKDTDGFETALIFFVDNSTADISLLNTIWTDLKNYLIDEEGSDDGFSIVLQNSVLLLGSNHFDVMTNGLACDIFGHLWINSEYIPDSIYESAINDTIDLATSYLNYFNLNKQALINVDRELSRFSGFYANQYMLYSGEPLEYSSSDSTESFIELYKLKTDYDNKGDVDLSAYGVVLNDQWPLEDQSYLISYLVLKITQNGILAGQIGFHMFTSGYSNSEDFVEDQFEEEITNNEFEIQVTFESDASRPFACVELSCTMSSNSNSYTTTFQGAPIVIKSCSDSQYFDFSSQTCVDDCETPCNTCSSANVCSDCLEDLELNDSYECVYCDVNNCAACSDDFECKQCDNNYYSQSDSLCTACPDLSTYNNTSFSCDCKENSYLNETSLPTIECICDSGYGYDSGNNNCSLCSQSNCTTCTADYTICEACDDTFYLNDLGQCIDCPGQCESCLNETNCIDCIPYADFNQTDSQCTCTNNSDYNSTLDSCICNTGYGYNLLDETCLECSQSACAECPDNYLKCQICENTYYLDGSEICQDCPGPCANCSSSSHCLDCVFRATYDENNFNCECIGNSTYNETSNECECNNGYGYDSSKKSCVECAQTECLLCNNDYEVCEMCGNGYYLNESSLCSSCPDKCLNCSDSNNCFDCVPRAEKIDSDTTCSCIENSYFNSTLDECQCSEGYGSHSSNDSCIKCNQSSCLSCQNDYEICDVCDSTYYLDNGVCKNCDGPCLNCTDIDTCIDCIPYATLDSEAQNCSCVSNSIYNETSNACECDSGYGLDSQNNDCQVCEDMNCLVCSSNYTECETCDYSFYLNATYKCESCPSPCANCSSESTCLDCVLRADYNATNSSCECVANSDYNETTNTCECVAGYGYNSDNGACELCEDSNCIICSSNYTECDTCDYSFYLNATYQCESCPSPCANCSSESTCLDCVLRADYNATNSSCECIANSDYNETTNTCECVAGYGYNSDNGACELCEDSNCIICSSNYSECDTCDYLFYPNATYRCENCPSPCANCSSESTCLDCVLRADYNATSSSCECTANSDYNETTNTCECVAGYGYNSGNGACEPCEDSNCYMCPSNYLICDECNSTYYLSDDKVCVDCPGPCYNCLNETMCVDCVFAADYNESTMECMCTNNSDYNLQNDRCECIIGYGYNENDTCVKCSQSNCLTCPNNYSICESCDYSYFLNDTHDCEECPDLCTNCSSSDNCSDCVQSAFRNESLVCECVGNSTYNITTDICECDIGFGYDLNTSYCAECNQSNCLACENDYSICEVCENTYYLNNVSVCTDCVGPCNNCESEDKCLDCVPRALYNETDMICTCIDNSEYSNETNSCECVEGYGYNYNDETCDQCSDSNCLECSKNYTKCDVCDYTYYLNDTLECSKCPEACANCTNSTYCLDCVYAAEYQESSGTCNCTNHSEYKISTDSCECISGYGFDFNQTCQICDQESCIECYDNFTICETCDYGYFLNDSGTCNKCKAPCGNCSSYEVCLDCVYLATYNSTEFDCSCINYSDYNNETDSCECISGFGYNLSSELCEVCSDENCLDCKNNNSICETCDYTYYLDEIGFCKPCQSPCSNCSNISTCIDCIYLAELGEDNITCSCANNSEFNSTTSSCECVNGYGADSDTETCQLCDQESCLVCADNYSICELCDSTYYLNQTGECLQCSGPCLNCTNDLECIDCVERATFNSSNSSCQCIENSDYDNITENCECIDEYGYNSSNETCVPCNTSSCALCSEDYLVCTECKLEYYLSENDCLECGGLCKTCKNDTFCLSCFENSNYDNETGICECIERATFNNLTNNCECTENSAYENDTNTCECLLGYGLSSDNNSCIPCNQSSCSSCSNNYSICDECKEKYYLGDNEMCVDCPDTCANCSNSSYCYSCVDKANLLENSTCSCIDNSDYNSTSGACECYVGEGPECLVCSNLTYYNSIDENCSCIQNSHINDSYSSLVCDCDDFHGYDSINNICKPCDDSNCLYCESDYMICDECSSGYFINSSSNCQECPETCSHCLNETWCTECVEKADYDELEKNCTCIQNSIFNSTTDACECFAGEGPHCTVCPDRSFYNNDTDECECVSNAKNESTNSELLCICEDGYGYKSQNDSCESCDSENCALCTDDYSNCTQCNLGYYLGENNQCYDCPQACSNCSDSQTCNECSDLAIKNQNGTCSCIENSDYNDSTKTCECIERYGYNNDTSKCELCEDINCLDCSANNSICETCISRYYLNETFICSECPVTCKTCTNASFCLDCVYRAEFSEISSNCTCIENSEYNSTTDQCECLSGEGSICQLCPSLSFYNETSHKCECIENSYNLSNNCVCNYGYGLNQDNDTCHTCGVDNCLECTGDYMKCDVCYYTYYANETYGCSECVAPCLNCSNETACIDCIYGADYDSVEESCTCTTNSKLNSTLGVCTCDKKYGFNSSENCGACADSNCNECYSNYLICEDCKDTYYLDTDYSCQKCQSPCKNCVTNSTTCLNCIDDSTFNATTNTCNCKGNLTYNSTTESCGCPSSQTRDGDYCYKCRAYLTSEDLISFNYSTEFDYLFIKFSVELKSISSCSDISYNSSYFGKSAKCSLVGKNTIKVKLGSNWKPLTSMFLNEANLLAADSSRCITLPTESLVLDVDLSGLEFFSGGSIEGLTEVFTKCSSFKTSTYELINFSDLTKTGVSYSWSVSSTAPSIDEEVNKDVEKTTKSKASIDFSKYEDESGYLILTVYFTNGFNITNQTFINITLTAEQKLSIGIDGDSVVYVNSDSNLKFSAKINDKCGGSNGKKITYTWTYSGESGTEPEYSANGINLIIKKNALYANVKYQFSVTAKINNMGSNTATLTIYVNAKDLIIKLNAPMLISTSSDASFDASSSYDPNNYLESPQQVYSWSCVKTDSGSCSQTLIDAFDAATENTLTVPGDDFSGFESVTVKFTFKSGNLTASQTAEVKISDEKYSVNIQFSSNRVAVSSYNVIAGKSDAPEQGLIQYSWYIEGVKPSKYISYQLFLITFPYAFDYGKAYNLKLDLLVGGNSYEVSGILNSNNKPVCSDYAVSPTSGELFSDIFYLSATCYDIEQDYPLFAVASFEFKSNSKGKSDLKVSNNFRNCGSRMPKGKIYIYLSVCDTFNDCDTNTFEIEVKSGRRLEVATNYTENYIEARDDDPNSVPGLCSILASSIVLENKLWTLILDDLETYINSLDSYSTVEVNSAASCLFWLHSDLQIGNLNYDEVIRSYAVIEELFTKYSDVNNSNDTVQFDESALKIFMEISESFYSITKNISSNDSLFYEIFDLSQNIQTTSWLKYSYGKSSGIEYNYISNSFTSYKKIVNYFNDTQRLVDLSDFGSNHTKINLDGSIEGNSTQVGVMVTSFSDFDIFTKYGEAVEVKLTTDGHIVNDQFVAATNNSLKLDNPLEITIKTSKQIDSENYTCGYWNSTGSFFNDSCTILDVTDNTATIQVTHLSFYGLEQIEFIEVFSFSSCSTNHAPIIIMSVVGFIMMILIPLMIMLDSNSEIESLENSNSDHGISKTIEYSPRSPASLTERPLASLSDMSIPDVEEISESIIENPNAADYTIEFKLRSLDDDDKKVEKVKKSCFTRLIEGHLLFGLYVHRPVFLRAFRVITLFSTLILQLFLEGIFLFYAYGTDNSESGNNDERSTQTLFDDYKSDYFGYCIVAIAIAIPFELLLILLFSKSWNKAVLRTVALVLAFVVVGGSIAGIIILTLDFCFKWSGYWAISFLWSVLIEIFFLQVLYMFVRFPIRTEETD